MDGWMIEAPPWQPKGGGVTIWEKKFQTEKRNRSGNKKKTLQFTCWLLQNRRGKKNLNPRKFESELLLPQTLSSPKTYAGKREKSRLKHPMAEIDLRKEGKSKNTRNKSRIKSFSYIHKIKKWDEGKPGRGRDGRRQRDVESTKCNQREREERKNLEIVRGTRRAYSDRPEAHHGGRHARGHPPRLGPAATTGTTTTKSRGTPCFEPPEREGEREGRRRMKGKGKELLQCCLVGEEEEGRSADCRHNAMSARWQNWIRTCAPTIRRSIFHRGHFHPGQRDACWLLTSIWRWKKKVKTWPPCVVRVDESLRGVNFIFLPGRTHWSRPRYWCRSSLRMRRRRGQRHLWSSCGEPKCDRTSQPGRRWSQPLCRAPAWIRWSGRAACLRWSTRQGILSHDTGYWTWRILP